MRLHHGKNLLEVSPVRSDINVTPLVDVCLVLLIIFMVVTPMLQKGVNVALPETNLPEKMPENQKQLTVSVKNDGSVYVGSNYVPEAGLPAAFKQVHDGNPDREVVLLQGRAQDHEAHQRGRVHPRRPGHREEEEDVGRQARFSSASSRGNADGDERRS
jgi:biopolymer transport protein ExbD